MSFMFALIKRKKKVKKQILKWFVLKKKITIGATG